MEIDNIHITTKLLFQGAGIFFLLDALIIPILSWRIKPQVFIRMKWLLVLLSGLVWFGIWQTVLVIFWDSVYGYLFPAILRSWLPVLFGLIMSIACLIFWSISQKNTKSLVLVFCLLAGTWGIITHTLAIFRGVMVKPPMLQGASPLGALVLAFFEYIFYWCIIIAIAGMLFWFFSLFRKEKPGILNDKN